MRRKFFGVNIAYLIGSLSSFALMMSNGAYNSVAGGYDAAGNRKIDFSLTELYYRAFKFLTPNYCREFWLANVIIAVSVIAVYFRSEKSGKKLKYGKLCAGIIASYAVYSVYSTCFEEFQFFTQSMTVRAFECVFAFAYVLSIAYFLIKIPDRGISARLLTYLVSTLIVTLPFLVVSPMTPRCMYHNYMFWILLSGELFMYTFRNSVLTDSKVSGMLFTVLPLTACIMICGMNISDHYYNRIRYDYLREQLENGDRTLKVIKIPYLQMEDDLADDTPPTDGAGYNKYIFKYYDIPVIDKDEHEIVFIAPIDYNI